MAILSDHEIYERIVNQLPFTDEEQIARDRYWSSLTPKDWMGASHEMLRRHYRKLGIDVDSLVMDKSIVRVTRRRDQGRQASHSARDA
ncbi:MAG TPA: hypothetical protein VGU46_11720 [Acidobacteriaceae bacterium]|nr:hypothetical protein [Acidobacteriaceae bacterium]